MKALPSLLVAAGVMLLLSGCVGIPADALKLPPDSLANRQMQSRAFAGLAEPAMLSACAGVLQDLGFTVAESETKLGVIVATKERTAVDKLEVTLNVLAKVASFGLQPMDYAHRQVIRASLVTRPSPTGRPGQHNVRVTFQRQVYNNKGMIRLSQTLNQGELYNEFYHRLAQSVTLEALVP
jgi:hypothetical protein